MRVQVLVQVVLSSEAYEGMSAFRHPTKEFGLVIVDRVQVSLKASVASEDLLAASNFAFERAIVLVHMFRPLILLAESQVAAVWFVAGEDLSTIASFL